MVFFSFHKGPGEMLVVFLNISGNNVEIQDILKGKESLSKNSFYHLSLYFSTPTRNFTDLICNPAIFLTFSCLAQTEPMT